MVPVCDQTNDNLVTITEWTSGENKDFNDVVIDSTKIDVCDRDIPERQEDSIKDVKYQDPAPMGDEQCALTASLNSEEVGLTDSPRGNSNDSDTGNDFPTQIAIIISEDTDTSETTDNDQNDRDSETTHTDRKWNNVEISKQSTRGPRHKTKNSVTEMTSIARYQSVMRERNTDDDQRVPSIIVMCGDSDKSEAAHDGIIDCDSQATPNDENGKVIGRQPTGAGEQDEPDGRKSTLGRYSGRLTNRLASISVNEHKTIPTATPGGKRQLTESELAQPPEGATDKDEFTNQLKWVSVLVETTYYKTRCIFDDERDQEQWQLTTQAQGEVMGYNKKLTWWDTGHSCPNCWRG